MSLTFEFQFKISIGTKRGYALWIGPLGIGGRDNDDIKIRIKNYVNIQY